MALLLMIIASGPAWAEAVVLSSTAPGMKVGRVLADDETVSLPDATLTTVLLADGRVLKLRGPAEGKVAQLGAGEQMASASASGGWSGVDVSALGGTRGELTAALPAPGGNVSVDLHRAGTWCVTPQARVRAANDGAIKDTSTGRLIPISAGQPWPVPITDGATFLVHGANGVMPLRFRLMEDASLFRLARAGCLAQAGPVLRQVGASTTPFSLYLATDRGLTPRYAIGEQVTLILQANRPAHLACVLIKNGAMTRLFPTASGWTDLADHQEMRIPGDKMAVQVAATPPPGMGELRCYAVDGASNAALPELGQAPELLDAAFKAVPEAALAASHLFIRVQ
ncbi:MAG: DUF4384 domain-containing protein [Rhodospirillaceae bacterium]|nr:DUF4384 domain-containing protein [Rhodospirillales bacterium]